MKFKNSYSRAFGLLSLVSPWALPWPRFTFLSRDRQLFRNSVLCFVVCRLADLSSVNRTHTSISAAGFSVVVSPIIIEEAQKCQHKEMDMLHNPLRNEKTWNKWKNPFILALHGLSLAVCCRRLLKMCEREKNRVYFQLQIQTLLSICLYRHNIA